MNKEISMNNRIKEINDRLSDISKEQNKLDRLIEKQEKDGNYNDALYQAMEKLEEERTDLRLELQELGE
jgi:predicted  nucleic acid-binding Zn-ribbon protein